MKSINYNYNYNHNVMVFLFMHNFFKIITKMLKQPTDIHRSKEGVEQEKGEKIWKNCKQKKIIQSFSESCLCFVN